jgi:hypothetical protein
MRSPLASEESGVCCPREVVGDAAQMASGSVSGLPRIELEELATRFERHGSGSISTSVHYQYVGVMRCNVGNLPA